MGSCNKSVFLFRIDADGAKRTVDYTADPVHGFNAVVRREPLYQKSVVAAPLIQKSIIAAPTLSYAQPIATGYSTPLLQKSVLAQPLTSGYSKTILG